MSLRLLVLAVSVTIAAVTVLELRAPSSFLRDRPSGCEGFDFPVGAPEAAGYYNAQPFGGRKDHLGDDWNGIAGGNSDLGDPVTSVAAGVVTEAADHGGGWGRVVRVVHFCADGSNDEVESLYAHLDEMDVEPGERVVRGQRIGTIGDAHGAYSAHLHLELRDSAGLPLGPGYGRGLPGYLDPTAFIRQHRPAR